VWQVFQYRGVARGEIGNVLNGKTVILWNSHLPDIRSVDWFLSTANKVFKKVNCHLF